MSKTDLLKDETTILTKFPKDFFPIDLSCLSSGGNKGQGKIQANIFVVTSSDGKFHLISQSGRIEKTVDAHKGAVLTGRWSPDTNALVTTGEDGKIKIWSRSGMLRSTLVQSGPSVYSAAWSPESDRVVYTCGKQLVIQSLQPSIKPLKWKAHEEIILALDWSLANNMIVSGGEDCKYKVWDNYGILMFSSSTAYYPITAVSWSPCGDLFAVGTFNVLQLCDKSGWSHGQEAINFGSILNISWSNDATQVTAACADGNIISAHCINKRLESNELEAVLVSRKTIHVKNVVNDTQDILEMRDRVIKMSLGFDHLVIVTTSQCLIYTSTNFNTPSIFELRNPSVSFLQQCESCFALIDVSAVLIYSYEGRQISVLKLPSQVHTYMLNNSTFSISKDVCAVKDGKDERLVHFFDTTSGRLVDNISTFSHSIQVVQLSLSQCGHASERYLAVIDKNRDLYLVPVKTPTLGKKLAAMIQCVRWNQQFNMLCGLRDNKLLVWLYPKTLFVDVNILNSTVIEQDINDSGKNLTLLNYSFSSCELRRADGSKVFVSIPPYPFSLHDLISNNKWNEGVKICRFSKSNSLWACLAAMSMNHKKLDIAEIAYAAIKQVDKVEFLNYIKRMPNKDIRAAKTALFCGNFSEAESILLRAGLIYHIIQMNMDLFDWERALDVAIKHKTHVDTVLAFRQLYLEEVGKKEANNKFKQYSEGVNIQWDKVRAKVEAELQAVGDSVN